MTPSVLAFGNEGKGAVLSYTQSLHLIGKVGSVRHPRMAALETSSSECYEKNDEGKAEQEQRPEEHLPNDTKPWERSPGGKDVDSEEEHSQNQERRRQPPSVQRGRVVSGAISS